MSTEDIYEVTLPKPIGVKFARGNDGGAYVAFVPPEPEYDEFEIGDKSSPSPPRSATRSGTPHCTAR